MPTYKRIFASAVYLPDVNKTVDFGEVVDLPEGFFLDDVQAQNSGFALATEPATVVPDRERGEVIPELTPEPVAEPVVVAEPAPEPIPEPAVEPVAVAPTFVQE